MDSALSLPRLLCRNSSEETDCQYVISDIFYSCVSKPLRWLAGEVKTPPMSVEARREMGFLLRQLQEGENLSLPSCRPMPTIGSGCSELRVPRQEQDLAPILLPGFRRNCDSGSWRKEDPEDP